MSSNLSRNITSRKVFLSLAAAAIVAVVSLTSGPSYARGFVGGHLFMGGGRPGGGAGSGLGLSSVGRHPGGLVPIHPRPPGASHHSSPS